MLLKIYNLLVEILKIVSETQDRLQINQVIIESCPNDDLLDNADAKRLLQISDKTLFRWRKEKLIEYQIIGNKHYYRKSDLKRFL
ncbi:hypothetical protein IWX76_000072 [Pedobacter sp. CAN_A7]|uniref:helix-turn-helix domain-containing protein n=1 Tax=Pedobacter sp. CAN_A7 TaxID=2787722 RepID=UPI0018CA05A0